MLTWSWLALVGCTSYPADPSAEAALVSDDQVRVVDDGWIDFQPVVPLSPTAVVFYPGGLVVPEAYAEPLRAIAASGVRTVLVRMPSDLAVLAPGAAQRVFDEIDGPARWVIAGHSLGGAMAAAFAADHEDALAGLGLWAAYPPDDADLSDAALHAVTITATADLVLDREAFDRTRPQLPPATVDVVIDGGNHAGFGSYGPQDGDGDATIPRAEQHRQVVDAMLDLIERIDGGPLPGR